MSCEWNVSPEYWWNMIGVKVFKPKGSSGITRGFFANVAIGCLEKPKARLFGNFLQLHGISVTQESRFLGERSLARASTSTSLCF